MNNLTFQSALKNMDEHLSDDHITLASLGLRRIQQFYGIPASDMAAGRYNDQIIGDEMNGKFKLFNIIIYLYYSRNIKVNNI